MSLVKHVWTQSLNDDDGLAVVPPTPTTITGNSEQNFLVDVAPSTTVEVDMAVTVSKIQSGYLISDHDVTVNTNASNASGGQTITLLAGVPFLWNTANGASNPFTPNITKFYAINASSVNTARVRGGFILQTP